jgi:anti-sigma28 factor (negative regulator of flagellin synthesis)
VNVENIELACIRSKKNMFNQICAKSKICEDYKKLRNAYHARISAVRRWERTRQLQQESIDLNLEIKKAAFDLELAEVERQHEEQKVEEIKQEYINYKRRND